MSQVAPKLTQALDSMPTDLRARSIRALATTPRIQGRWFGSGGRACFFAAIMTKVNGVSKRQLMKSPIEQTANAFGMTQQQVVEAFSEWDRLPKQDFDAFVARIEREFALQVDILDYKPRLFHRVSEKVHQLVGV